MKAKATEELIGVAALVVGLFLGLTLLPVGVTGPWGRALGDALWALLGAGAVFLPVLGLGWALAAFDRLGPLSARRAAALGAGLVILVPYAVGLLAPEGPTAKSLAGLAPGFLARAIQGAIGTAGGALVGILALSALGILTVGWHPLSVLRTREGGRGRGRRSLT